MLHSSCTKQYCLHYVESRHVANRTASTTQQADLLLLMRYLLPVLLVVALFVATACSIGDDNNAANTSGTDTGINPTGDGSLGFVTVPAGQPIQLRLVLMDQTGTTAIRIVQMALADYGDIGGFNPTFGDPIHDPCRPDSAESLAYSIIEDPQVIGIVGPTCSTSSVAFSPVISNAGLVTITSFSEASVLTSNLAGTPGSDYHPGFYRTTANDTVKANSIARFVYDSQGITTAAVLHTGNVSTRGLAEEFEVEFGNLGGTITSVTQAIASEDLLAAAELITKALATEAPAAVLLALYPPSDIDVLGQVAAAFDQAAAEQNLSPLVLIADGTMYKDLFNENTRGMFFSLADQRYDNNLNQGTEVWTDEFLARYIEMFGEAPDIAAWAQTYDATTLLLDAIAGASYVDDAGNLVIDRQGIRAWLNQVNDYQGLSGPLNCDRFGDCGSVGNIVVQHIFSEVEQSLDNVVFEYSIR